MEKLINNKKYLTLILIGLLTLVIGVSLSFIMFDLSGNDNSIMTGQISMTYVEPSNEVVLKEQLPITDELGINSDKYFEFSVMSNATTNENDKNGVNIFYEISLSKKEVEQNYNQLEDKDIKIYLTKVVGNEETVILEPTLISDLEKSEYGDSLKIYDTKNKHHSNNGTITTKYRLRFWIDNEVDASDWYLKNKYEYRFVVNVNGHAPNLDLINDNTLSTKIKTMYTVENGTAKEEDGYYYLKGTETVDVSNDLSLQLLSMYGELGNVYLYRQEVDNDNVEPVANIKKITDDKGYTYNQELLEHDIRNYMISSGNVSEAEYDQLTGPFGGYLNTILGMFSGVVNPGNMTYVEGKTIDDIPTMDEMMSDQNASPYVIDVFEEIMSEIVANNKKSFFEMYYDGKKINLDLLNENLRLGAVAMNSSNMITIINTNFGNITNYSIAKIYELTTYDNNDMPILIEGKTIEDIPTLESILINTKEEVLLTNTYVELNNILWKVVGINNDNSVKLMSVYQVHLEDKESFETGNVSKYFGFNNNNSPFSTLLRDTTLEDIIIKTEYRYEEDGKEKKVLAYASMPTYEDIKNAMVDKKSYLYDFENGSISVAKKSSQHGYRYISMSYSDEELYEGNENYIHFNPVITIEDIEVIGEGTKSNPYKLESEKTVTEENFAKALLTSFVDVYNTTYSSYKDVELYKNMGFNYNVYNSSDSHFDGKFYSAAASINNKCYYQTIDGYSEVIDYSEVCSNKFIYFDYTSETVKNTYSYNETSFTATGVNIKEYQWQQKVGNEWISLEDYAGRISGTKTATLTILPTSVYEKETKFRCIGSNGYSKNISNEYTMNLTLTDGEFVYEEIEDTNKYQIISYVGDYTNSMYFAQNQEDNTLYDFVIPSNINGDLITNVQSLDNSTILGSSTFDTSKYKIKTIKLENGIKEIYEILGYSNVTDIELNDTLEVIGSEVFRYAKITELNLPKTLKNIGFSSFYDAELTELEIPSKLIAIESSVFYSSQLTELEIPENVESIGTSAFYFSPLEKLNINSNKIKTIGASAFYSSKLTSLTIPEGVEIIGAAAFYSSPLTNLELPEGLKEIQGSNNWVNEAMYEFGKIEGTFGSAKLEELTIPETVTNIGIGAFRNSEIKELIIPSSVVTIGIEAFYLSPLTKLTINEGVTEIGAAAFYSSQLTSLEIPKTVIEIGGGAFYSSPLTQLTLNEGLKHIVSLREYGKSTNNIVHFHGAFEKAKLTDLKLPSTLLSIGARAFFNSPLTELSLPENLIRIEELAFCNSKLTELEIPSSVEKLKAGAFYYSPLTKLTLHEGLRVLESEMDWQYTSGYAGKWYYKYYGVFENAQLTELSLPKSLYKLEGYTFYKSRFTDLKVYGKTTLYSFTGYEENKSIIMAEGYEPQFIEGTLE